MRRPAQLGSPAAAHVTAATDWFVQALDMAVTADNTRECEPALNHLRTAAFLTGQAQAHAFASLRADGGSFHGGTLAARMRAQRPDLNQRRDHLLTVLPEVQARIMARCGRSSSDLAPHDAAQARRFITSDVENALRAARAGGCRDAQAHLRAAALDAGRGGLRYLPPSLLRAIRAIDKHCLRTDVAPRRRGNTSPPRELLLEIDGPPRRRRR